MVRRSTHFGVEEVQEATFSTGYHPRLLLLKPYQASAFGIDSGPFSKAVCLVVLDFPRPDGLAAVVSVSADNQPWGLYNNNWGAHPGTTGFLFLRQPGIAVEHATAFFQQLSSMDVSDNQRLMFCLGMFADPTVYKQLRGLDGKHWRKNDRLELP